MSLVVERRRRSQREFHLLEPERKRICKSLETSPQDMVCYLPRKCPMDYWNMEEDLKLKTPTDLFSPPQIMKEKPNSMNFAYVLVNQTFPDNETVTTAQPCPRCIAGEPGHLGHIMGL